MTLRPALAAAQRDQARHMLDTVRIDRASPSTFDEATGQYTANTTTIYLGGCRVRPLQPTEIAAGDQPTPLTAGELLLPFSTTAQPRRGDTATLTASLDPRMVGRVFSVLAVQAETTADALVLTIQDRE